MSDPDQLQFQVPQKLTRTANSVESGHLRTAPGETPPADQSEEKHNLEQPATDPEEFLRRLKEEHRMLQWEPLPAEGIRSPDTNQVRNRASLEYLHSHWVLPESFDPDDAGRGIRGRMLSLFARLTFQVLVRYLHDERQLLAHMVRVNQALEQRCDALTLHLQQLNQDMIDRQVAEAANQAKLALWLHLEPPGTTPSTEQGVRKADNEVRPPSRT